MPFKLQCVVHRFHNVRMGGSDCAASASGGQSGEVSVMAHGGRRAGRDSL